MNRRTVALLILGGWVLLWMAVPSRRDVAAQPARSPSAAQVSGAGLSVTPLPSASATPACQLAWQWVETALHNPPTNGLSGLAALAPNDVWTVGGFGIGNIPATEHWDGNAWSVVPAASTHGSSGLTASAALSANNIWAVGDDDNSALIEHWDGQQWSVVPAAHAGGLEGLRAVSAVSANDIWAAGSADIVSGTSGVVQTLIEHWDGQVWSVIPSVNINPPGQLIYNTLESVSAVSANDVWAVGYYELIDGYRTANLVEHWDGQRWQVATVPQPGVGSGVARLYSVSAHAANDAWAVGEYAIHPTSYLQALHWDGISWQLVPVPVPPDYLLDPLQAVIAIGPRDAWAVGSYQVNYGLNRTMVEHWDGVNWLQVSSPNDSHNDYLNSIAAVSPTELWAVGSRWRGANGSISMHYTVPPGCPTLTPTSTPTVSTTPTFTPAPSVTDTATASATPQTTASPTLAPSATWTATPTPPSPTMIPSPAVSATPCSQSYADVPTEYWAYGYIHYLSCRSIISGYPDGLFRPDNPISRAEFSKMLALGYGLSLLTPAQPSFADVPASYWAYTYIETLHAVGAISGYPDGSFHPGASITRAELVKMNVLASGVSAYTGALPDYPDVPPSYWAYGYIKTATHKQWVGGYSDGLFHPTSDASRAELSKVLYLSLSYPRR